MELTAKKIEKFWEKVHKTEGCWLWTGATAKKGYGQIGINGKNYLAHRISYLIANGKMPEAPVLRHTCDVPKCVRPDHLLPGAHADNVRDMVERGRTACGVRNGSAKLDDARVADILRRLAAGANVSSLSREFRVERNTIRVIRDGQTWRHVPRPLDGGADGDYSKFLNEPSRPPTKPVREREPATMP